MGYAEDRLREQEEENRRKQEESQKFYRFVFRIVRAVGLAVFLLVGFASSCTAVSAGHVGVVQRFGAVQPAPLWEGVHFIRPFGFESVTLVQTQLRSVAADASSSSKDLQVVHAQITLQYSLTDSLAPKIVQRFGSEVSIETNVLAPAIQESVKSVTARYTAEQLITQRTDVKVGIEHALVAFILKTMTEKGAEGALMVANVAVTNFDFSKDFNQAIEAKVRTEQEALKAENEKRKRITQAEAEYAEKKLAADGTAYQTDVESKARADAIKREALALQSSPQLIELRLAEKWNGQLPTYTGASGIPLLNIK